MAIDDTKRVLWRNVEALMQTKWGGENLSRLAREAKLGQGTPTRIKQLANSTGIGIIQRIAKVFGVQTWQLLTPEFDPRSPPRLATGTDLSPMAADVGKMMDRLADDDRRRVYAILLNIIAMNTSAASSAGAPAAQSEEQERNSEPSADRSPPEPQPPAPGPTRKRANIR